jgi:hypothetical protein
VSAIWDGTSGRLGVMWTPIIILGDICPIAATMAFILIGCSLVKPANAIPVSRRDAMAAARQTGQEMLI